MGDGNNGKDSTEGGRVHHVIGTYLHGSLLPKNPAVADWLLARAPSTPAPPGSPSRSTTPGPSEPAPWP